MKIVEPAKSLEEVKLIESQLRKHGGDLYGDLWRVGVNMALRISDLLSIRFSEIDMESDRSVLKVKEGKTGSLREILINDTAMKIIRHRRDQWPDDVYLFQTHANRVQSMEPKAVSRFSVARRFQEVGRIVGVELGTHSMRKSRGWVMHSSGVSIEMIAKVLGHSSPASTMRYIGITKQEILNSYEEFEL